MEKQLTIGIFIAVGLAIFIWANWPRRIDPRGLPPIPPFCSTVNGFFRHDFFRNISLDEFTAKWPDKSFTHIRVADEVTSYIIAVVTIADCVGQSEFQTTFTMGTGGTIEKLWSHSNKGFFSDAVALFVLPDNVIRGTTKVQNKQSG